MVTALAARWVFTVVFAAAVAGALWPRPLPRGGAADPARRVPVVFCVAMCASLLVMTWWAEPEALAWAQAGAFGLAALAFGVAGLAGAAGPPGFGRGRLAPFLHALMAGAMVWMFTGGMPAGAGMAPAPGGGMASGGAMAPMAGAATSAQVLAISVPLAVCCAATALWWLARAVGPRVRVKDSVLASHAVMSAGMAALLFVMS